MSLTNGHEQVMLSSASENFKGCFNSLVDRQFFRYMHPCCNHYVEVMSMRNDVTKEVCDESGFASDIEINCE